MNVKINEYSLISPKSGPYGMTLGPDQEVWLTENQGNRIGKITEDGEITEYSIPTLDAGLSIIVPGVGKELWFTEYKAN